MAAAVRVLLIDDEPDFLETLAYWLRRKGHAVEHATGGAAGLELLARGPAPDVVFLDIVMPQVDGLETLRRLRQSCAELPVILLSTSDQDPAALGRFRQLGIIDVFSKEQDLERLAAILDRALAGRRPRPDAD